MRSPINPAGVAHCNVRCDSASQPFGLRGRRASLQPSSRLPRPPAASDMSSSSAACEEVAEAALSAARDNVPIKAVGRQPHPQTPCPLEAKDHPSLGPPTLQGMRMRPGVGPVPLRG